MWGFRLFGFICVCFVLPQVLTLDHQCGYQPADVAFLLDSSRSIWAPDFNKQLQFVNSLVDVFSIGKDIIQVSMATFSTRVYREFRLRDYNAKETLKDVIGNVRQRMGDTYTAKAIRYMRRRMFATRVGARNTVPHIGIILTDGESRDMAKTLHQAEKARKAGITIFSIGIGRKTNRRELLGIASKPASEFYFHVDSYSGLDSIKEMLAIKTCQVTKALTTTTTTIPTTTTPHRWSYLHRGDFHAQAWASEYTNLCVDKPLDIAIAIDSSSMVSDVDFWKQLKFTQEFVHSFTIGQNKTRVGMMTYNDDVTESVRLNDHLDKASLNEAIVYAERPRNGKRNIAQLIQHIREKVLNIGVTGRTASQVALIITLGTPADDIAARRQAILAQQAGIYVFIMAVGHGGGDIGLASEPIEQFLRVVPTVDALQDIVGDIARKTCELNPSKELLLLADEACGGNSGAHDIIFVVDSPNAGIRNTRKSLDFVQQVSQRMDIGPNAVQVGVVSDLCRKDSNIDLNAHIDKYSLKAAIQSIQLVDLTMLLQEARVAGFSMDKGGRKHSRRKVVLFVDGHVDNPSQLLKEAEKAKILGIEMFVIYVGSKAPQPEVVLLSSEPRENHFLSAKSYDDLTDMNTLLLKAMC